MYTGVDLLAGLPADFGPNFANVPAKYAGMVPIYR